ncbi:helix-turn-helix domain-containing protein [Actinomadura bangladeshensis]|uniref:XRE family transcriptional regulator n=1 Tax=Actinomadura bangladeshensis TaxID=453573 RepID=A0A4R4PAF9_9ACTN|nr:helix-turn-helix transcriptional regulator [Actinomadura bangladeshensis]TDC19029.1 XRE family transcriptional regulator [Actinomadura bangladeshensis]
MTSDDRSSYRRRKIGQALRRYREERNLTQDAAARLVERSPATLSAYENGHRAVRPRDLRQILDHYGITDARERARLLDLAAQGRKDGWWLDYQERTDPFIVDYASLEGSASGIREFEPHVVPGLLQTEAYTRAVFSAYDSVRLDPRKDGAVGFRMARQRILVEDPPRLTWIITEAALRAPVGGACVMKEQLRKILAVTVAPHLSLQVLPLAVGEHPGLDGAFSILDIGFDEPMRVVAVHSLVRSWFIDESASVAHYGRVYEALSSLALTKAESRALIEEIVSAL